jgi:hypothetical protein
MRSQACVVEVVVSVVPDVITAPEHRVIMIVDIVVVEAVVVVIVEGAPGVPVGGVVAPVP